MQLSSAVRIIFIGLICVLIGFFIWSRSPFFNEWMKNQYFGEIITRKDGMITMTNQQTGSIVVHLDAHTAIIKGRQELTPAALATKTAVLVIGDRDEHGELHAKVIRIFPPKK